MFLKGFGPDQCAKDVAKQLSDGFEEKLSDRVCEATILPTHN